MSYIWNLPTKVLFGAGKVKELDKEEMPGKKALLVISNPVFRGYHYIFQMNFGTDLYRLRKALIISALFFVLFYLN